MGLFDHFPYTNFHEINLMWILEALKEIETTTEQFVAINSLKYADPIQWNITSQYEKNTIVIDPLTGTAYISVQPVPSGVSLTNTDYWTVVFDLGSFVTRAAKNFTTRWEADTTLTATFPTSKGEWLVCGDTLYKALVNITAGDQYVVNSNIEHITMEQIKNEIYTYIDTLVGDLNDLTTTDKSNLVAAINEVATQVLEKIGNLDDLSTSDKTNLVAAINEVMQTLVDTAGNLDNLTTTDKSNLVAAINEAFNNRAWISSTDFGVVGDGITDDAPAFVRMLSYAKDNNKSIKLESNKIFALSYGLHIPSYTYIDGSNSEILWLSESSVGFQCHNEYPSADNINPNPLSDQATGYNGNHDIVIKNIKFNSNHPTIARSCSVVTFHALNVLIENCEFIGDDLNHAIECNSSKNVIIDKCRFSDSIAGSDIGRSSINIDIASINGIPGYGTSSATYDNTPCTQIRITNCTFNNVMACFDSHGTVKSGGTLITPVTGIIVDNLIAVDCEIISTMVCWNNFVISNVFAKGLKFNFENVGFYCKGARSGKFENIFLDSFINGLGSTANAFRFNTYTENGITERCHDIDINNLTILCAATDLVRIVTYAGASFVNFTNVTIKQTGAGNLFACVDVANYDCVIKSLYCGTCNDLLNDVIGSNMIFDDVWLNNNTGIGTNNGYLRITNSRFKELTISNLSNNYRHSNVGYMNRTDNNVITDMGYNNGVAITDGSYVDVNITYTKTFYTTPRVFVTQYGGSRPKLEFAIQSASTTGATIRIRNNSGGDYTDCPFLWLAIRDSIDT